MIWLSFEYAYYDAPGTIHPMMEIVNDKINSAKFDMWDAVCQQTHDVVSLNRWKFDLNRALAEDLCET